MMTIKHQGMARAIIFGAILLTGSAVAFTHFPPKPLRSAAVRGGGVTGSGMKQGSSDTSSSNSNSIKSRNGERQPAAFGWTNAAGSRRAPAAASRVQQGKVDWSKLFATPEPEPVRRNSPLVALSRSFAGAAQESFYASPLCMFFSVLLMSTSCPLLGAQTAGAWGVGRLAFSLSMRGEDVSRRMPLGFVGYASLFLVVGGLMFMNGLKRISSLGLVV